MKKEGSVLRKEVESEEVGREGNWDKVKRRSTCPAERSAAVIRI